MRYFHQPIEYWLDHCTLQDWRNIYQRELIEAPPPEAFLAGYFEYDAPGNFGEVADEGGGEVVIDLPEFED